VESRGLGDVYKRQQNLLRKLNLSSRVQAAASVFPSGSAGRVGTLAERSAVSILSAGVLPAGSVFVEEHAASTRAASSGTLVGLDTFDFFFMFILFLLPYLLASQHYALLFPDFFYKRIMLVGP
ncbi:hypothetical protein ACRPFF_11400, partial [Neisseria sp. SLRRB23]